MNNTTTISKDDIRAWFKEEVSADIESLIETPIIEPGHSNAENHAYLSWFIKNFLNSDPASVQIADLAVVADGKSDGGIDLFIEQPNDGVVRFDIYQISRPHLEKLRLGRQSHQPAKLSNDVRTLRNALTERKIKRQS